MRTTTIDGLIVIDKPGGITSHGVVSRVRRSLGIRRVGHAGTLDPMATGVLVVGLGRGTRLLTFLTGADKRYAATIRLGWATSTDDCEGEPVTAVRAPDLTVLSTALEGLRGPQLQKPSVVSAIKVDGTRAYDRVRRGEAVDLPARAVHVWELEVEGAPRPVEAAGQVCAEIDVRVHCSSGTYVRALARDLGVALGTGGHLTALRRTAVGPFDVADSIDVEVLGGSDRDRHVIGLGDAAGRFLSCAHLDDAQVRSVSNGLRIRAHEVAAPLDRPVALLDRGDTLVAVAVADSPVRQDTSVDDQAPDASEAGPLLRYLAVFAPGA